MIGPAERRRLEAYLDEVYRWNLRSGMTTVPRRQAWTRHVGQVTRLLAAAPPAPGDRVVDVGSGLGVPGIPLALLRPDCTVTLMEPQARRAGFLIHVAGLLGLDNVRVQPIRAEDAGRNPPGREGFDLAVARALAPAPVLCELVLPLVRSGGRLAALVSWPDRKAADCAAAARACGGGAPVPAGPGVMVVPKLAPTPEGVPRRASVARRRPLG